MAKITAGAVVRRAAPILIAPAVFAYLGKTFPNVVKFKKEGPGLFAAFTLGSFFTKGWAQAIMMTGAALSAAPAWNWAVKKSGITSLPTANIMSGSYSDGANDK